MNFYFTGTGNSLYIAKQLDEENDSIPQVLRQDEVIFSDERIGIVCPIYGHEMPKMVKVFLKKATFDTKYLYIVLSYGARHGGAAELAKEYLESIGKKADYISTILMVDNFLPAFDMTQQIAIDKNTKAQINAVKADIEQRKCKIQKATLKDKMTYKAYLAMVQNAPETIWANFRITDDCIGCGICTRVCPAGCIRMEGQHAVNLGEGCQACYACIQACPKMAILFGKIPMKEPNPTARYRNPNITLTELVQANDQTRKNEGVKEK